MNSNYIKLIKKASDEPDPEFLSMIETDPDWSVAVKDLYGDNFDRSVKKLMQHSGIRPYYDNPWDSIPLETEFGSKMYTEADKNGDPKYIGMNDNALADLSLMGKVVNNKGTYIGGKYGGKAYRWIDRLGNITNTTKGIKDTLFELLDNYTTNKIIDKEFEHNTDLRKQIKDLRSKTVKDTFWNNLKYRNAPRSIGGFLGGRWLKGKSKLTSKGGAIKAILGDWLGGGLATMLFKGLHSKGADKIKSKVSLGDLLSLRTAMGRDYTRKYSPGAIINAAVIKK